LGIGGSAGGLEAFTKLLENLPAQTGMAFVFIQHLATGQESMLTEILSRSSNMPVHKVENDMEVEPDNVYVIPPDVYMPIENYSLQLAPQTSRVHRSIDAFLISLAKDLKSKAIGVVLSGTGTDGTEGIRDVYAQDGITFAQDVESAKYDGMPRSAIDSGVINFVLPPEKIAKELSRIGRHPYLDRKKLSLVSPEETAKENNLQNLLALLRLNFGVDFFVYKESTLNRRISRRMIIHKIEDLKEYTNYVRNNNQELQTLFDDLLIGVTGFFREPETFNELEKEIFPEIVSDRSFEPPIRIWVPGCSTGEEVYSIAIKLNEFLQSTNRSIQVQIFGTDVSEKNILRAREGIYPEGALETVSEKRRKNYFTKTDLGHQIRKDIREQCIFAKQDLIRDPPFSNLDLISCRNVLIYLKPRAQKRIIPLFHYALKPTGFSVLGKSESIGTFDSLFNQIDRNPIFSKKDVPPRLNFESEAYEFQYRKKLLKGCLDRKSQLILLEARLKE
jgi:two-component system CheB/CheR fusion protein